MSDDAGGPTEPEGLADGDGAQPGSDDEEGGSLVVVSSGDEGDDAGDRPDVEQPGKLLRIASMVQRLLAEVRDIEELDEASRRRLADVYGRAIEQLHEVVSPELSDELTTVVEQHLEGDQPPSKSELQVVKAQLVGWLEGLFHGIQATIASQQMAAQEQLARLRQQQELESGRGQERRIPGQYL